MGSYAQILLICHFRIISVYYDVDASKGNDLNLIMNFTSRAYSPRLWEIRVVQIPFSQRAPTGCLQYFTGLEGLIEVRLKLNSEISVIPA